jgi:hypothetical protein
MHVDDLRPMFDLIVRSHVPGQAIYADPSFAASLRYEYPSLGADIHSGTENTVTRPGWYIQRVPPFNPAGTSVVMRIGSVTAARTLP